MLDDPTAPAIYRVSGESPFPEPFGPLPDGITPRQILLRDRVTIATIVPFSSPNQVPPRLTAYLCELLNREIEKGDTYPMMDGLALSSFAPYWFANFGAIMIMGAIDTVEQVAAMEDRGVDWAKECLGSFYIKPNYPGRSSHICNGGFLVTDAARNRGVGRQMGECYLIWAPKLGYTYSIFNLVYETNVASVRIWDALGFKRVGRVKGCGNLKSYPDELVDALIFGRDLGGEKDDQQVEERFDKIRFYLRTGTYPAGADRAEKSRLRSAATHYKLAEGTSVDGLEDRLMLKGKEVVADPYKQSEIAQKLHQINHGGINKTTAAIAEQYHWVRIKETVSAIIRNCSECKETPSRIPSQPAERQGRDFATSTMPAGASKTSQTVVAGADSPSRDQYAGVSATPSSLHSRSQSTGSQLASRVGEEHAYRTQAAPTAPMSSMQYESVVDPQLMQGLQQWQNPNGEHMEVDRQYKSGDTLSAESMLRSELEAHIVADNASFVREQVRRERDG